MEKIQDKVICDRLRELLDKSGTSIKNAARRMNVAQPALWRQLHAVDPMPVSRAQEMINIWSPSEEEAAKLTGYLNGLQALVEADQEEPAGQDAAEVPSAPVAPVAAQAPAMPNFDRIAGRLEAVSEIMEKTVCENVPEAVKPTVLAMAGLIEKTIEEISAKAL